MLEIRLILRVPPTSPSTHPWATTLGHSDWAGREELPLSFSDNFVTDWAYFNPPDLSSDSDSDEEEDLGKLRVYIKPLEAGDGGADRSVSVEELERAVRKLDLRRHNLQVRLKERILRNS